MADAAFIRDQLDVLRAYLRTESKRWVWSVSHVLWRNHGVGPIYAFSCSVILNAGMEMASNWISNCYFQKPWLERDRHIHDLLAEGDK